MSKLKTALLLTTSFLLLAAHANASWTTDLTPPTIDTVSLSPNCTSQDKTSFTCNNGTVSITANCSDSGSGIADNGCQFPSQLTASDTTSSFSIRAIDKAGNITNQAYSVKFVAPRQECPTTCHTDDQNLPDGNGGTHLCPHNQSQAEACPSTCHTDTQYKYDGTSCSPTRVCSPNAPAAQSCPATCHADIQYVSNGSCGQTTCSSNAPAAQSCPTSCHTDDQTVPNGSCGTTSCPHNQSQAEACPSTCHTDTQYVYDGSSCSKTKTCSPNNPAAETPPACRTTSGSVNNGQCGQTQYQANCTGDGAICQGNSCILPPTVDLKVNNSDGPVTVNYNEIADLSWTTTNNPTSCTADLDPDWSGSKSTTAGPTHESKGPLSGPATHTYRITCYNAAAPNGVSDSVQVNVLGLCSSGPNNCSACSTPTNTCSTNNGTQTCTLTGPGLCTPTQTTQACSNDSCTTGNVCNGGQCAPPPQVTCSGTPPNGLTGQTITWTAVGSGGIGSYNYSWSGDASGNTVQVSSSYSTEGTKIAHIAMSSGSLTTTNTCQVNVTMPICTQNPINCTACSAPPNSCSNNNGTQTCILSGPGICRQVQTSQACTSNTCSNGSVCTNGTCLPTVTCSAQPPTQVEQGSTITWVAQGAGGIPPYTYSWTGDDGLTGNADIISRIYINTGIKHGSVTITDSASHSNTSSCINSANIIPYSSSPFLQTTGGDVHTQQQINTQR